MFGFLKTGMASTELELSFERVMSSRNKGLCRVANEIVATGTKSLAEIVGEDHKKLDPLVTAMYSIALSAHTVAIEVFDPEYILVCSKVYEDLNRQVNSKYFVEPPSVADRVIIQASSETFRKINDSDLINAMNSAKESI